MRVTMATYVLGARLLHERPTCCWCLGWGECGKNGGCSLDEVDGAAADVACVPFTFCQVVRSLTSSAAHAMPLLCSCVMLLELTDNLALLPLIMLVLLVSKVQCLSMCHGGRKVIGSPKPASKNDFEISN
jgi:hypothetical protein